MEYHGRYDREASAVNLFRFSVYPKEFISGLLGLSLPLHASPAAVSDTGKELLIRKGVENQRRCYLPWIARNREVFRLLGELPLPNDLTFGCEKL